MSNELWRPLLYAVVRDFNPTTIQLIHKPKGGKDNEKQELMHLVTYSLKREEAERIALGTPLIPRGLRRAKFSFRGKIPLVERDKATVRISFVEENGWTDEEDKYPLCSAGEEDQALKTDLEETSRGSFREYAWILEELFPCESATKVIEGHWEAEQKSKRPLPPNPIYGEALGHVAMCKQPVCVEFMKDYQYTFMDKAREALAVFKK